jgi:hemerythrin
MPVEFTRLGIDFMDADHERLAGVVAGLSAARECGSTHGDVVALLRDLYAESRAHFAREEREMERIAYPLSAAHKEEHGNLLEALRSIVGEFEDRQQALDEALVRDLWEWLNHHVTSSDLFLADHLLALRAPAQ